MSGFVALLDPAGTIARGSEVDRMVQRARLRGPDQTGEWSGAAGRIAVVRAHWEAGIDFAGPVLVLEEPGIVVAADASLYYRDDLVRQLRAAGHGPAGSTPSHLIAAAYRAWGAAGVARLEGDFAFLLWDTVRQQLLAAREFTGGRPLYFAAVGSGLLVGSDLTALSLHPAVDRALNLPTIAEDISAISTTVVEETVFCGVRRVPAGSLLRWESGQSPRLERFWEPPFFGRETRQDSRSGEEQLRDVLGEAVRQRMSQTGKTTVWMSGGYDSPAVFAMAQQYAGADGRGPVEPVSMSYPPGDAGREDELIQRVADHFHSPVQWVPIGNVPGWTDPVAWAAERDQPAAHPYERWNASIAEGTLTAGARVGLTGNGGDQFFAGSLLFLADLVRAGRGRSLLRELRSMDAFHWRALRPLFRWTVQPLLPQPLDRLATALRGGEAAQVPYPGDPAVLAPHRSSHRGPAGRAPMALRPAASRGGVLFGRSRLVPAERLRTANYQHSQHSSYAHRL